jgi:hypothetical protein
MAGKDADPDDDLPLDPPESEQETEQEESEQETEAEEQETEPEEGEVEAQTGDQERQAGERQPSRRDRRIETLTTEVSEARRRNDELNRRLDQLLAGARQPQGETPEQRAQRLALLTPEERIQETLRESEVKHAREMQTLQFSILDGNDRAAFEAKATVDPLYAKWKPKVETELSQLRQQGQNVDREKLMYYLIGKNAVEARKQQGNGQRAGAQRRLQQQRTRPANSGSDTSANRRDRGNSLERRLENQSI